MAPNLLKRIFCPGKLKKPLEREKLNKLWGIEDKCKVNGKFYPDKIEEYRNLIKYYKIQGYEVSGPKLIAKELERGYKFWKKENNL